MKFALCQLDSGCNLFNVPAFAWSDTYGQMYIGFSETSIYCQLNVDSFTKHVIRLSHFFCGNYLFIYYNRTDRQEKYHAISETNSQHLRRRNVHPFGFVFPVRFLRAAQLNYWRNKRAACDCVRWIRYSNIGTYFVACVRWRRIQSAMFGVAYTALFRNIGRGDGEKRSDDLTIMDNCVIARRIRLDRNINSRLIPAYADCYPINRAISAPAQNG